MSDALRHLADAAVKSLPVSLAVLLHLESVALPANASSIIAQDDPKADYPRLRRRLPTVVARRRGIGTGATGRVRIEGSAGRKPGDGNAFALVDQGARGRIEHDVALGAGAT